MHDHSHVSTQNNCDWQNIILHKALHSYMYTEIEVGIAIVDILWLTIPTGKCEWADSAEMRVILQGSGIFSPQEHILSFTVRLLLKLCPQRLSSLSTMSF